MNNTIIPISSLSNINNVNKTSLMNSNVEIPFKSLFEEAINNVKETDQNLKDEIYKLATGQTDNLHDITIASTKAAMSVELMVQLRNKTLDSYNELMRMGI